MKRGLDDQNLPVIVRPTRMVIARNENCIVEVTIMMGFKYSRMFLAVKLAVPANDAIKKLKSLISEVGELLI